MFVLWLTVSCVKNNKGEREAINEVIETTINVCKARDFDRMASVWLQDESIIRLYSGNHNCSFRKAWKATGTACHNLLKDNLDAVVTE